MGTEEKEAKVKLRHAEHGLEGQTGNPEQFVYFRQDWDSIGMKVNGLYLHNDRSSDQKGSPIRNKENDHLNVGHSKHGLTGRRDAGLDYDSQALWARSI